MTRLAYVAYDAGVARITAGPMPLTMPCFRYRSNQSALMDQPWAGSSTRPTAHCFDCSGCRLGLPPNSTLNCVVQSIPVSWVTGQRIGSDRPVGDTPWMLGVHNW